MKKLFLNLLLIAALLLAYVAGKHDESSRYYPATMYISNVNYDDDCFTLTDSNGDEWYMTGIEDRCLGDVCSMLMHDNGTPYCLYDDIAVRCWFSGFSYED